MESKNNVKECRPLTEYPNPFVVDPKSGTHNQTFILVHGGGLHGQEFGEELLRTLIPVFDNLPAAYPDAKFVFPIATEQFSEGLGMINRQFFDLGSVRDLDYKDYKQIDGLHDSVIYIHNLLKAAVDQVGADNVILGGLSQGCAVSLLSLLLWEGPPIAAVLGMAGWLPFRKRIEDSWTATEASNISDPAHKRELAISCLRQTMSIPARSEAATPACLKVPVFIGHGIADDDLLLSLARPTHNILVAMGLDVHLRDYEGLGHWYSGEMLQEFINFTNERGRSTAR